MISFSAVDSTQFQYERYLSNYLFFDPSGLQSTRVKLESFVIISGIDFLFDQHFVPLSQNTLIFYLMRLIGKSCLLLATLIMACDAPFLDGGTWNAGTYSTIIDAQNGAVDYLVKKYNSIPADTEYKVKIQGS